MMTKNNHTDLKHQEHVRLLGTRNLYIRTVYAHIEGYTRAMGAWRGTQRDLATQLELPQTTVGDQLVKLIEGGFVVQEGNSYRTTAVQKNTAAVQESTRAVQNVTGGVQKSTAAVSPHTPLYNKIQKKEINTIQSNPKDMDGGEVSPERIGLEEVENFSLELFTQYYRLMPYKAKSTAIKRSTQNEFCALPHDKQQAIIEQLRREIDDGVDINPRSPLLYLRSFVNPPPPPEEVPEGEPHNYNHEDIPPDKFVQPAKYKGEWGMYCLGDVIKYKMEINN